MPEPPVRLIKRLRLAVRLRVWPWRLPRAVVTHVSLVPLTPADIQRSHDLAPRVGWRRLMMVLWCITLWSCGPTLPPPGPPPAPRILRANVSVRTPTGAPLDAAVGTLTVDPVEGPGAIVTATGARQSYALAEGPIARPGWGATLVVGAPGYLSLSRRVVVPDGDVELPEVVLQLAIPPVLRLRVVGRWWQTEDGQPWVWHGLTAFPLIEMVAHGRTAEAEALLTWAASTQQITIVRALAMAGAMCGDQPCLFRLTPEEGRAALPATLDLVAKHGLHMEVVALADTRTYPGMSYEAHVAAIGQIAALYPAAVVEIGNEIRHFTQDSRLDDPAYLMALRGLVPSRVMVALGAAHGPDDESRDFTGGDYVTVHGDRADGDDGWRYIRHANEQRVLSEAVGKPVINDEPLRDDPDLAKQRAGAWLTGMMQLGDTFHYASGLRGEIPTGAALDQFRARAAGWTDIPAMWRGRYYNAGFAGSPVKDFSGAVRVYSSAQDATGLTLVLGRRQGASIGWSPDWPVRTLLIDLDTTQLWSVKR